jgi:hypothetical protein
MLLAEMDTMVRENFYRTFLVDCEFCDIWCNKKPNFASRLNRISV